MKKQFFRVKQLADQTFSRSGKTENLTDELQAADKKVEYLRTALQALCKRLTPCGSVTQGQDPAAREKRLRKLPEFMLGLSMKEASIFDDDSLLKYILMECGKTEIALANEIAEHELKVEQLVCAPLNTVAEQDLPAIMKTKKQLNRLMSEKDSAVARYQHLLRAQGTSETNAAKVTAARDEMEDATSRVSSCRDALAGDMFALVAREAQLAHTLLQYVKLQRAYHESALHSLQEIVPELEKFINDSSLKPVFGFPLEEHLRVSGRTIAFPVELCVCALNELGLAEEGLFRIAGASSKVRRMKLSLDAGIFRTPLPAEYRDVHVVASVLKSYLRELPEPLLTYRLYESFLTAVTRHSSEQAKLNAIWDSIHQLPEANYQNLRYIVKFLAALTQNQATNKMTSSNLAIVIAPNLLWASDESTFDMNITTSINCVVELLIKHADWFFSEDMVYFVSFTKEDLLPDLCEYGFSPGFMQGAYNHTIAVGQEQSNGDYNSMTKSVHEAVSNSNNRSNQGHSRSNSHDTSLILVESDMKRAQSNSSLSDHSSPPHGSPKPITRRKNKPIAPVPPNFTPPDKRLKAQTEQPPSIIDLVKEKLPVKSEIDKPNKPPRPVVSETGKIITGVQTINRSTYKQNKAASKLDDLKSASRESLNDIRRQSLDFDKDEVKSNETGQNDKELVVRNVTAVTGVVGKMKIHGDGFHAAPTIDRSPLSVRSGTVASKQTISNANTPGPPSRPVAAPRSAIPNPTPKTDNGLIIDAETNSEVQLRTKTESAMFTKPAVPERPPTLRPQSFRATHRNSVFEFTNDHDSNSHSAGGTVLERTHVYSVDKQHPTIIHVGNAGSDKQVITKVVQDNDSTSASKSNADDSVRSSIQRTQSTGGGPKQNEKDVDLSAENKSLSSQSRQLSQSEGNIVEVTCSVPVATSQMQRPTNRPPRPTVPAPPPPSVRSRSDGAESTDL